MDHRTRRFDEDALTAEHAAEWLHRMPTADAREKELFLKWIRRSPQNGGEVLVATSTDLLLRHWMRQTRIDVDQLVASSANVLRVVEHTGTVRESARRKRRLRLLTTVGIGMAAALAALFVAPGMLGHWLQRDVYTTSIGEQRAIELPDGSAIAINAKSSVTVDYTQQTRDIYLNHGQAMFTVAKDPLRPFRVHVISADRRDTGKAAVIQALGTKFDVQRRAHRINVAVIEGVVQIHADAREPTENTSLADVGGRAKVAAGQAVSIDDAGLITPPAPVNPSDVSAWQQRRLVFTDNTLEEITEEFRRYNRRPTIRIQDDDSRNRRFSGVFDADYPEALLLYLATDDTILLERDGDVVTIRQRTDAADRVEPRPSRPDA